MTRSSTDEKVLVLRDPRGSYFAIPDGALDQWRVPAHRVAELERVLADDTAGFWGDSLDPNSGIAVPGTGMPGPHAVYHGSYAYIPWLFPPPPPR